jgi:AraC family transcriptional regulator of adaptative response/methylated-DNA-[protein]-cysteine methyltransferase
MPEAVTPPPLSDPRWPSVRARDRAADGSFVYAVITTGVFCRPSCGARRPNPENVRFFANAAQAEAAGFRACKRCQPTQQAPHAACVEAACRTIEAAETPPSLAALASQARLSPFHFHRVFRQHTGLTPRAYAQAARSSRLQATLAGARTVTEAIYDAGFNAPSRFYAAAGTMLGMSPTAYRKGGAGLAINVATGTCSLGAILVAATSRGLCAILLGEDPTVLRQDLVRRFPHATISDGSPDFAATMDAAIALVEAPGTGIGLTLDVQGTAFQHRVWQALQTIPAGSTASYTQIATRIGAPKAARAVAAACAANPAAVAIPCHRVVGASGALSGYRWGLDRKRRLLARETT